METDLVIRQPAAEELHRVAYLFRNVRLRPEARVLVAAKSHPIVRFLGAAAWWAEGSVARFQLACQPGVDKGIVVGGLTDRVLEDARSVGLESVQYADLLTPGSESAQVLQGRGFEHVRSERFFEIAYAQAWARVMDMHDKHKGRVPASWRTVSIGTQQPEAVLGFISPHRLIPPEELRDFWRADMAGGFDLEHSCILLDGEHPFGAFLLRPMGDAVYIDVLVVHHPNRLLRSLGELCLFYHGISRVPPDGFCRTLQFRSGEAEHRQTGNLAFRMGGRELGRLHVYGRRLTA